MRDIKVNGWGIIELRVGEDRSGGIGKIRVQGWGTLEWRDEED